MKIKLNNSTSIDLAELIDTRMLIQANSGGGKSYTIRRIIEQAFGHVQIIVIDPEGEFGNMRSKYDFVYVGKEGDTPAETRSASLLAKRLLELKASAIIDLYELPPQERKRFVKLFCEAMVNAPKELWHDCLVIIDEAHIFAPEKSESEALDSVINLTTLGRKRGYCVVLASQRISKLHKDAAAECNNKLIGRTSLDIDRKRAGEELGLTSKEEVLALRNLVPGEFMVFGPAIGGDVQRVIIGDVSVKPAKRGVSRVKPLAASSVVKKILAQLKDLPKEAQEEATTVAALRKENAVLKRELKLVPQKNVQKPSELPPMGVSQWKEYGKKYGYWAFFEKQINQAAGLQWEKLLKQWKHYFIQAKIVLPDASPPNVPEGWMTPSNLVKINPKDFAGMKYDVTINTDGLRPGAIENIGQARKIVKNIKRQIEESSYIDPEGQSQVGRGEVAVLTAIAQQGEEGLPTREAITTITGYKRSTRDAYMARLLNRGYIFVGSRITATEAGLAFLGDDFQPLPTGQALRDHLAQTLPKGERDVLMVLFDAGLNGYSGFVSRDQVSQETSFRRSTRDAYIARLANRQLIEVSNEGVRAVLRVLED